MKHFIFILAISLFSSASYAKENAAEQLVASKKQVDMTYKQLMEIMGKASAMIHEGIIRENKQMIIEGSNYILNHPAPKHKPWLIMKESDQEEFKLSLLSFDKILDTFARRVSEEATKENWLEASNAVHDLNNSCITCHSMWKSKVK